jgi:hypothetical protein
MPPAWTEADPLPGCRSAEDRVRGAGLLARRLGAAAARFAGLVMVWTVPGLRRASAWLSLGYGPCTPTSAGLKPISRRFPRVSAL